MTNNYDNKILTFILYNDVNTSSFLSKNNHLQSQIETGKIEIIESNNSVNEIQGIKDAFNKSKGEYIVFLNDDIEYTNKVVENFLSLPKKQDTLYCAIPVYKNPKEKLVNYISNNAFLEEGYSYNLDQKPSKINMCLFSYFISRNLINLNEFFIEGSTKESILYGLANIMDKSKRIEYLKGEAISSLGIFDAYNYSEQYYKEWYEHAVRNELIPLLKDHPESKIYQNAVRFLLYVKLLCNWNVRDDGLLINDEVDSFFNAVYDLLQLIDDDVLLDTQWFGTEKLARKLRYRLFQFKHNDDETETIKFYNKESLSTLPNEEWAENLVRFNVNAVNYDETSLQLEGRLINAFALDKDVIKVFVDIDGNPVYGEINGLYAKDKFFGKTVRDDITFSISIPVESLRNGLKIKAYYDYHGEIVQIPFNFVRVQSRISPRFNNAYWIFGNWMLKYKDREGSMYLLVKKYNKLRHINYERQLFNGFIKDIFERKNLRPIKATILRAAYWFTKKKNSHKSIWIIYDQLFKGGDNGEYFFKYVMDHGDLSKIQPYYIINKDAKEYSGLKKKYGENVLEFNTFRCKLLSLHADLIFATRVDVHFYCGIATNLEKFVRDLFNADVFCLQHGLTVQNIAQYQNRIFDNTKLYFLVSPLERENLLRKEYNYTDDMLVMTGAPRYDGLVSKDKKQIIISPTWRRSVTAGTNTKGSRNEYSTNFKNTEYYKIYNGLINDERLMKAAKDYGYKLIYLIHPILSPQIKDFGKSEFVEIIPGSEVNYEKILTESSLMLTDYSGIQFDFAYMRKPVVYYHPETLPPQYDSSVYIYEKNGLGPVCTKHDEIVDTLVKYIESGCQLEEEYKNRIEGFFGFDDRENSKRVYEETIKYLKNKGDKHWQ